MTPRKGWMTTGRMVLLMSMAILLVDQILKIWVKTHLRLHETIDITGWFKICFVENNGMAYGMEIGSKLLLSLFRIVLIGVIARYVWQLVGQGCKRGYVACLTLILAGAVGNMIDGMFYGLVFNAASEYYVSFPVPFGSGYAPFMMGKVVDMFYFPIIESHWPQWMPFVGGEHFVFFSPVFNIADSCISVGAVWIMLFYRHEISQISFCMRKRDHKSGDTCKECETKD